jgi:hypothetical protein
MGINFHCLQVTLRHEGLPLFLRTSSRLIEWKRTNCKMITRNKISAVAGSGSSALECGRLDSWVIGLLRNRILFIGLEPRS